MCRKPHRWRIHLADAVASHPSLRQLELNYNDLEDHPGPTRSYSHTSGPAYEGLLFLSLLMCCLWKFGTMPRYLPFLVSTFYWTEVYTYLWVEGGWSKTVQAGGIPWNRWRTQVSSDTNRFTPGVLFIFFEDTSHKTNPFHAFSNQNVYTEIKSHMIMFLKLFPNKTCFHAFTIDILFVSRAMWLWLSESI